MPPDDRELSATERGMTTIQRTALIMFHLTALGKRLSTADVARLAGVSERGGLYIMHRISGADVPLAFAHGKWYLMLDDPDSE